MSLAFKCIGKQTRFDFLERDHLIYQCEVDQNICTELMASSILYPDSLRPQTRFFPGSPARAQLWCMVYDSGFMAHGFMGPERGLNHQPSINQQQSTSNHQQSTILYDFSTVFFGCWGGLPRPPCIHVGFHTSHILSRPPACRLFDEVFVND